MRLSILVAVISVAGCGSKNTGMDMGMDVDMAMADVDMAPKSTCSISAQDCDPGMKCIPTFAGTTVTGKCGADGTVTEGMSCTTTSSSTQVLDNCKAGLICDNTGTGSDTKFACRKYCKADSACTNSGERCISGFGGQGWCVPTCTPAFPATTAGCPTGSDCGGNFDDISATMSSETGFFVCKQTGAGALFADCMADSDCGVGLWCDNYSMGTQTCMALCDSGHACQQPPADAGITTLICTAFTDQSGKGYCYQ